MYSVFVMHISIVSRNIALQKANYNAYPQKSFHFHLFIYKINHVFCLIVYCRLQVCIISYVMQVFFLLIFVLDLNP
jgi:hypothetical protein